MHPTASVPGRWRRTIWAGDVHCGPVLFITNMRVTHTGPCALRMAAARELTGAVRMFVLGRGFPPLWRLYANACLIISSRRGSSGARRRIPSDPGTSAQLGQRSAGVGETYEE